MVVKFLQKLFRVFMASMAFLTIPLLCLGLKILGLPTPMYKLYIEWCDYCKSGKAWGPIDELWIKKEGEDG